MLSTRLMKCTGVTLTTVMGALAGHAVQAAEQMDVDVLLTSCQAHIAAPESDAGDLCRAYLLGVLAMQHAEAAETEAAETKETTYVSRASRTRAGQLIDRTMRDARDYCLATDVPVVVIMEYIIQESKELDLRTSNAAQLVHAALAQHGAEKLDERFDATGAHLDLRLPAAHVDALQVQLRDASRDQVRIKPL